MPLSIIVTEVYLLKAVKQSICHRIKWNASLEKNADDIKSYIKSLEFPNQKW